MKRINLFIAMVMTMAIATSSLISCGGSKDKDSGDTITDGCDAGEAEKLALLAGAWTSSSITQDDGDLVDPLEGDIALTFTVDAESCENNFYSVTGGEYLLPNATDEGFTFVEGSSFLRLNLGDDVAKIESVTASELVLVIDYVDPTEEDSRVLLSGEYIITFTK